MDKLFNLQTQEDLKEAFENWMNGYATGVDHSNSKIELVQELNRLTKEAWDNSERKSVRVF